MKTSYGDDDLAYIEYETVEAETEKAYLFKISGGTHWVPKSQIRDKGEELFAIPKWLADAKGLEGSYK